MVLRYNKRAHQEAVPNDSLWSGIITPFHSGDYDQTQTKFFEIWLQGEGATVSVDLGQISEDRDGNGQLNYVEFSTLLLGRKAPRAKISFQGHNQWYPQQGSKSRNTKTSIMNQLNTGY